MQKGLAKKFALIACCSSIFAGSAFALPVIPDDGGAALQTIFDAKYGAGAIDAINDQVSMPFGFYNPIGSFATLATFSYEANGQYAFGIYSLNNPSQLAEIFGIDDTAQAMAQIIVDGTDSLVIQTWNAGSMFFDIDPYSFSGLAFGFYAAEGAYGSYSNIRYSDPALNNGEINMLAFQPSGAVNWVFATEMNDDGGARFDEVVAAAESIAPVPEPGTMALFGTGLIGIGTLLGRKKT